MRTMYFRMTEAKQICTGLRAFARFLHGAKNTGVDKHTRWPTFIWLSLTACGKFKRSESMQSVRFETKF